MKRLLLALIAATASIGAQQPTFKSGVQLIEVDVRVFDKSGRFVTDLAREDFEVVEDGVAQRVEQMFLIEPPPKAATAAAAAAPAAQAVPAGPSAPQTWIFFFDLPHLTPGTGFDRARKAVEDFVRERFREGDLAGVVSGDKMVNNRITSVRAEVLEAVKRVQPRSDSRTRNIELTREWPRFLNEEEAIRVARNEADVVKRVVGRACADDPDQCRMVDAEVQVRTKGIRFQQDIHRATMLTLAALNTLAGGLARVPGPKTLVLISDGFTIHDIETSLRSVVGQAARAGARIYSIDVRGLNRLGGSGIIDQALAQDPFGAVVQFDSLEDGTNSLAVDTGGVMIRNENNLGRALDRIAEDAGRYYVLAYQPSNATFDGKYRPIQVRVKREGLTVRARRGYLALEPAKMLKPQPVGTGSAGAGPVGAGSVEAGSSRPDTPPTLTPPEPPAPVAAGAVVAPPTVPATGTVRLRPDEEARVKALAAGDRTPTSDLAQRGWQAYERGDVETAQAAFAEAAARQDVRPWVLYALGMTHIALNRPADAVANWERVRAAAPDFEPVYMDLADTYAQSGDLTRALAIVREAEKRWPNSAEVQSAIGVIHVRRGALDEGITALTRAAELTPDDPLAHLNLGRAYALRYQRGRRYVESQRRWVAPEGDREKALAAFEKCVRIGGPYAIRAKEEMNTLEWSKLNAS